MDTDLSAYKSLFLQTAQGLIKSMQGAASVLATQPTTAAVTELFIASHSLKGQSMTMGYTGIAKASLAIERYMRGHKDSNTLPGTAAMSVITDGIQQIAASVANIEKADRELPMSSIITMLEQKLNIKI